MIPVQPLAAAEAKESTGGAGWPGLLVQMLKGYERWLAGGRDDPHRWGLLDQFIREQLAELFDAAQVRCYRYLVEERSLEPLIESPDAIVGPLSADAGIVAHVLSSGQSFLRDQRALGEHLRALAQRDANCPSWCFPVLYELRPVGVVAVGRLPPECVRQEPLLEAVARVVSLMWARLLDRDHAALAQQTDRLSGVLDRTETLLLGDRLLRDAAENHEPVTAIAIAVEGLRGLDDAGQWGLRDQIVERIGCTLRRRLRSDDLVGRFTDERFVALLRRLDVPLGQVIAEKLVGDLTALIAEQTPKRFDLVVRGGLAAMGPKDASLEVLLTAAFAAATDARALGHPLTVRVEGPGPSRAPASNDAPAPQGKDEPRP
jgi:GGDEF domain-containing protein